MLPARIDYCAASGKNLAWDRKYDFPGLRLPSAPSFAEWNQGRDRQGRSPTALTILPRLEENPRAHPVKRFQLRGGRTMNRWSANIQSPIQETQTPCRLQAPSVPVRGRS